MKLRNLILIPVLALATSSTLVAQERNVSQTWLDFVAAQEKGEAALIPDYSYAGYHFGEKGVPTVEGTIFNVCDYGAVANDGKSDREAFQAAIAAATKNKGGVIFFPAGRYHLRAEDAVNESIVINCSNIVLRGEGMGEGGTEIFMEYPNPTVDPKKLYASPALISIKPSGSKAVISKVAKDAARGSFSVELETTKGISVGDWVNLEVKNNDPEFIAQELSPYQVDPKWKQIIDGGNIIYEFQQVTAIDGNTITFKAPLMRDVETRWGWVVRKYPHLEEVGVEGIAFRGNFHEKFVHHKNWLHDGGYTILQMMGVVNSWVRECSFTNVNVATTIAGSANVSAYNCAIYGHIGHSGIKSQGSTRVFLGNIDDQPAQWHSTGVSKPAIGTVIWRCRTAANSCFECHASQPRLTLFDASQGGFMRGRAGGAVGSNPNHMGGLTFWNYNQTNEGTKDFDFWATDTPFWRFVMPLFIGFHSKEGEPSTFVQDQVLLDESHGTPVYPESLYEAQIELRLGSVPAWLKEIKGGLYENTTKGDNAVLESCCNH